MLYRASYGLSRIFDKGARHGQQEIRRRAQREERRRLSELISKGKVKAKTNLKARILQKADQGDAGEGWGDKEICRALDTSVTMVARVREKLVTQGLCLHVRSATHRRLSPSSMANAKHSSLHWPARSRRPGALAGRSACWPNRSSNARSSRALTSIPSPGR